MSATPSHSESPGDNGDDPMNFSTLIQYMLSRPQKNEMRAVFEELVAKNGILPVLKATFKGAELLEMLLADSKAAGQLMKPACLSAESAFQDVAELSLARYQRTGGFVQSAGPELINIIQGVLKSSGFRTGFLLENQEVPQDYEDEITDTPAGPNEPISHEISMPGRTFRGQLSHEIGAHFYQMVNRQDGLLIAFNNLSPTAAYDGFGNPENAIPALQRWSDVAYLQWSMCTEASDPLKFVLQYHVKNPAAEAVVQLINSVNDTEVMPWPGTTYETATEEGLALLGTPNGIGVAYLLIQHKANLGHKTIDKITVFRYQHRLMLLFHITQVQGEEVDEQLTDESDDEDYEPPGSESDDLPASEVDSDFESDSDSDVEMED